MKSRPEQNWTEIDMKLKAEYLVHTSGNQTILVPTGAAGFSGVVQGNRTFQAILEQLQTDTSEEQIIKELSARFDATDDVIRKDVIKVLEGLRKIGALDE